MLYTQVDVSSNRRRENSHNKELPVIAHNNLRISSRVHSPKETTRFNGQSVYAINHEARQTLRKDNQLLNKRVQLSVSPNLYSKDQISNKKPEFVPKYANQRSYKQKMMESQLNYIFGKVNESSSGAAASQAAKYPEPYHERDFVKISAPRPNNISEYLVNRRKKKDIEESDIKLHFSLDQLEEKRKVEYHKKFPAMAKPQEISIRRFWSNFSSLDPEYKDESYKRNSLNDAEKLDKEDEEKRAQLEQYARPVPKEEPDYGEEFYKELALKKIQDQDVIEEEPTEDGINLINFEEVALSHPYKLDQFTVSEVVDIFEPCLFGKVKNKCALMILFRKLCTRLASQGLEKGHPLADCILHKVMLDKKWQESLDSVLKSKDKSAALCRRLLSKRSAFKRRNKLALLMNQSLYSEKV